MPTVALRRSLSPTLPARAAANSCAAGVVLHVGRVGFGIGENFSGGVDDGGASAGSQAFLRSDFGERVGGVVGFDAMREEKRLLCEVALDLGAQRGFPRAANHHVENDGGGGDDDHEDGEEFEEDAVLQFSLVLSPLFIWGTRSGIRRRARFSGSAGSRGRARFFRGCGGHRHRPSAE